MKLELEIDRVKPKRLPGRDLAQAMMELSKLLGDGNEVHFTEIREGSTICVAEIGVRHNAKARARIKQAGDPLETDIKRHIDALNRIMFRNKTSARLQEVRSDERRILRLQFPGILTKRAIPLSIKDRVQIQGRLYRIEGRDKSIHAGITDDEDTYSLLLSREQAIEAKSLLFELVRVEGTANVIRDEDGKWRVGEVDVDLIEALIDLPISHTIAALRELGGLGWANDPETLANTVGRREE